MTKKLSYTLTSLLLAASLLTHAQNPATVHEYDQAFPTYDFSDPSSLPLLNNVYPYFRFDGFTDKPISKKWHVVELQNDYIRVLILPQIGGKIWAAIEKATNRPFLYYNHAVKFRDVAMRGPWTSGGLEANYGIIGHTPNCATPVDYLTRINTDGSVSCFIGALDLLSRGFWRIEIRLPKDEAAFTTRSFWYNTTALEQPYYHWMNAGLKAAGNLQFIYPGNRYLGHNGEYAAWPINTSNGKDISWYRNNDFGTYKSYHVFGKYADFAGVYWHDDDFGMVRFGRHDDKPGKKLWIWGLSGQGMIWEKLLTDTDGQYIELQSGRLFNQNTSASSQTPFKHHAFQPYGTDTWEESWYPVLHTKGFVTANESGALNVLTTPGRLNILFSPIKAFHDTIRVTLNDKLIYSKAVTFSPLQTFADSIPADSGHFVITLGELRYDSDPNAGNLSRPVDAPSDFNWNTAYGQYLKGVEAMDQKNYVEADTALQKALAIDSNFLPALTQYANLLYRNLRYDRSLYYATRALSINTEDGPANFIYGLANEMLGHTTDAKDGFDIATLDPAIRSAAYTRLARISIREQYPGRARLYTEKALLANPLNIEARHIRALCTPDTTESLDPLDHFAHCQRYLANPTETNKQQFLSLIRSELPQQTFLELGIWYYNLGYTQNALHILQLAPPDAEISLWIAYLAHRQPDYAALDPTRVFPFRAETAMMLESMTADHWMPKYFLALIYYNRNRLAECKQLLEKCGDTPSFAPFYVFRAALADTPLHDLQKAAAVDPQWRYKKLLAEYYLRNNETTEARAILETWQQKHPEDYIMGSLYAKALLLDHQYARADSLLTHLDILPAEGATSGHDLYREAKLMQAVAAIKKGQRKKALSFITAAKQWPSNLGVGEPYIEDQDLRLESWLTEYCKHPGIPPIEPHTPLETRVIAGLK